MNNIKDEGQEIIRFVKVLLVVTVLVVGIYFFTRAFVTKDLFEDKKPSDAETNETVIDYNAIVLGSTFNRPYDEYYVFVYDNDDSDVSYYFAILSKYTGKTDSLKVYYADLGSPINKNFFNKEESNPKALKASELKISGTTLIKIKDGKIVKYAETKSLIESELS